MDKENKRQNSGSRILPGTAVQGLPSKEVDAIPTDGGTPVRNKKDTSKPDTLFEKME